MRFLGCLVAVAAIFLSGVVVATPASAIDIYLYRPSHPMNYSPKPLQETDCVGAWGIRSSLNRPYFLTAAHCFTTGEIVYGTDGRFGAVANAAGWPNGLDTAIVEPDANVDGWQEVPGVGRVVGKMSNLYLTTSGNGIAMQSPRSGRSYGVLYAGWELWGNDRRRVACGNYQRQVHDSGAPIFVHQGDRVYAAGVHVGVVNNLGVSKSCFVTIDDLLAHWNAWLPVFNSATGTKELLGRYSESREEV